jgi:hypothetical protein
LAAAVAVVFFATVFLGVAFLAVAFLVVVFFGVDLAARERGVGFFAVVFRAGLLAVLFLADVARDDFFAVPLDEVFFAADFFDPALLLEAGLMGAAR